ncbi:hypothetical protein [Streptomyces sp. NPDC053427]|uniref:hypothetical protein n=1 Tax=Streptomyces sp. NPDC053427 TaxID=3365701 RepID=UPI0037CD6B70
MHPPGAPRPRTVRQVPVPGTAYRTARTALAAGLLAGVLGTTAAALATAQPAGPAPEPGVPHGPVPTVSCGRPDSPSFPIDSRVHGGPATYQAGGDWETWQLELRNTTDAVCEDVHPVVVLTAARPGLRPERIRLEYRDPAGGDWRPVPFEATDHEEQIGVFAKSAESGGGERGRAPGGGLAVPANGTVTLPIRLRFAAGTAPGPVTANVTTVQRRGSDGEWIGQSGDYRFTVRPAASAAPASPESAAPPEAPGAPESAPSPEAPGVPESAPSPESVAPRELAATAQGPVRALALAAAGLFVAGALLLAGARRLRR